MLLPVAGWKVVRNDNLSSRLVPAAVIVAGLAQLGNLLTSNWQPPRHPDLDALFFTTVVGFVSHVIIISVAGHAAIQAITDNNARGFVLGLAMALPLIAVAVWRGLPVERVRVFALFGFAVGFLAIMIYTRDVAVEFPSLTQLTFPDFRHFIVPIFLMLLATGIASEKLADLHQQAPAAAFLILFAFGGVANYRVPQFTDYHWSQYAPAVDQWISRYKRGVAGVGVDVPINPSGWFVSLPATGARGPGP